MLMQRFLDSLTIHEPWISKGRLVQAMRRPGEIHAASAGERFLFYSDCIAYPEASIGIPPECLLLVGHVEEWELLREITGLEWRCSDWPTEIVLYDQTPVDPLLMWHERSYAARFGPDRSDDPMRDFRRGRVLDLRETPDALNHALAVGGD